MTAGPRPQSVRILAEVLRRMAMTVDYGSMVNKTIPSRKIHFDELLASSFKTRLPCCVAPGEQSYDR